MKYVVFHGLVTDYLTVTYFATNQHILIRFATAV